MLKKRHLHTATLLLDGTVLITGGHTYNPNEDHSTAEIYDPVTGTFGYTGFMSVPRSFHTATRLADGRVLVEQGHFTFGQPPTPSEIYDPVTHVFAPTGSPTLTRSVHGASLLDDGRVLVTGGWDENGYPTAGSELFDPVSGAYAAASGLSHARGFHTSTRLLDGRVLVAGGGNTCPAECSAELYDAAATTAVLTGNLSVARGSHSATLLDDGTVLVVGGQGNLINTATAELFDPATQTFTAAGALADTRWGHTATLLQDGNVLVVGGSGPLAGNGAELYLANVTSPLSIAVTPTTAALQEGESRAFTAVDHLGHPRTDALWSVTNGSIATVDPNSGAVTAVAAGSVTLTATIGAVSSVAQITVTTGPPPTGTPLWTVAAPAGATSRQLISAAAGGGPSLLAVTTTATETEVQGLTPDGQQQWHTWLPGPARQVTPNASGGVLLTVFDGCDGVNPLQLINIDGPTGIWGWNAVAASVCNHDLPQIAIRHDGAVAVATPGNIAGFPNLMMLDGNTGTALSVPTIPQSTFTSFGGQQTPGYSRIGPTMVDVDGTSPPPVLEFTSRGTRPPYPDIAHNARMRGVVVLELVADAQGRIDPRPLTDLPILTEAAVAHARQWRVRPTATRSSVEVYEFALDNHDCGSELNTVFWTVTPGYVRLSACGPLVNPN
jgi:Bacterial Ig-like domain (group 2)/Galactose oxidase, central domain